MTYAPTWNDGRVDGYHRLSDADRSAAVSRLGRHEAAGRLTADEVAGRVAAVRAARTRADLDRIFADLPADHPLRRAARDRLWRAHAGVFVVVATATIVVWLVVRDPDPLPRDYGADYWWPLWLALAWATLVLLHLVWVSGRLRRHPKSDAGPPPPDAAPRPAHAARRPPDPAVADAAAAHPAAAHPAAAHPADHAENPGAAVIGRLTAREREVLALIGQGRANKDIAGALYISERTARTHVSNILRKLELSSRTQAAILANQAGLATRDGDR
jgi:DNA-binding CsgD family transcriptional regulator